MRSRFTAFVQGDVAHLERTWDPVTRPPQVRIDPRRRWTRLEVIDTVDGAALAATGVVEFRAHFAEGATEGVLSERSHFRRDRGRWVYVDGEPGGSVS